MLKQKFYITDTYHKVRRTASRMVENRLSLTICYLVGVPAVYLLWPLTRLLLDNAVIFGIPLGFFLPAAVLPFVTWLALFSYSRFADNIDRHMPETENE